MIQAIAEANVRISNSPTGNLSSVIEDLYEKIVEEFGGWSYSSYSMRIPKNPEALYRQFHSNLTTDLSRLLQSWHVEVEGEWYCFEKSLSSLEDLWDISEPDYCEYITRRAKDEEQSRKCEDCEYLQCMENRKCFRHHCQVLPFQPGKEPKALLSQEDWTILLVMVMRDFGFKSLINC